MRTLKEINLVWKNTHCDFRGINDKGAKCVMYLDPTSGATTVGAIESLPESVWTELLLFAQKKETKKRFTSD